MRREGNTTGLVLIVVSLNFLNFESKSLRLVKF